MRFFCRHNYFFFNQITNTNTTTSITIITTSLLLAHSSLLFSFNQSLWTQIELSITITRYTIENVFYDYRSTFLKFDDDPNSTFINTTFDSDAR